MRKLQSHLSALLAAVLLLSALACPVSAASAGFADVPADHWAASYIARAADAGLVKGESANTFGLGRSMTRAAFVVVLCRLFGWKMISPAAGTFKDVQDPSAWYYSAVETALSKGAVAKQTGTFRPGDPVTREEMAVMLVRALGYTTLAGIDQGFACPFRDVESNAGYLTMAYHLGITGGTAPGLFSPEQTATREQAVAMLMRSYDRLTRGAPERIGILSGTGGPTDLSGYAAAAVPAAVLSGNGTLSAAMTKEQAASAAAAAKKAGVKLLLRVAGSPDSLGAAAGSASAIASAAAAGGYDGVLLDIPGVPAEKKDAFTALTAALDAGLSDRLLYVAADAPSSGGTALGYDFASLSAHADRLILRVAPYSRTVNGFPTAPLEPLEEVYYALAALKDSGVPGKKLSLYLTTTGSAWTGTAFAGNIPASEVEALLSASSVTASYSARYGTAYLGRAVVSGRTVVWYHTADSAAARVRMGAFFGVCSVCLSDLSSVADYADYSLLAGLKK